MKGQIIRTNFTLPTFYHTYEATFIAPTWARGFECVKNNCGLCCITERPDKLPSETNSTLGSELCRIFDIKTKFCLKYSQRPDMCKSYPFFLGVEEGKVIISHNLECPGSNGKESPPVELVGGAFKNDSWSKNITFRNDCYERAVLFPNLWLDADIDRDRINKWVVEFFIKRINLPFSDDVRNIVYNNLMGKQLDESSGTSLSDFAKDLKGLYIATRFDSFSLGLYQTIDTMSKITLFDGDLHEIKATKFTLPLIFQPIEVEPQAHELLKDYVSLLLQRPYLSLAATLSMMNGQPVIHNFMACLFGALVSLDISANIIAIRDNLTTLDRDTLREAISFNEGNLMSGFMRPDFNKLF